MTTKYKVLNADLKSPFEGFQYEIGKEYVCEDFDNNPEKDCAKGFYVTELEGLTYSYRPGRRIYEVEVGGKEVFFNMYKHRFEKIILKKEVPVEEIRKLVIEYDKINNHDYILERAMFPFNPLIEIRTEVIEKEINLLKEWASVGDSVWDSVWASVGTSVWASVGDSVWDSVWDSVGTSVWASVWASVGDSVWAYISSIFPNIKKWKYIDHEEGINPFQSGIDLWNASLVPSFDGETWRLHNGPKAKILYEWKP